MTARTTMPSTTPTIRRVALSLGCVGTGRWTGEDLRTQLVTVYSPLSQAIARQTGRTWVSCYSRRY